MRVCSQRFKLVARSLVTRRPNILTVRVPRARDPSLSASRESTVQQEHFPQVVYGLLEHLDTQEISGPILARHLPCDLCEPNLLTVCETHGLVGLVARVRAGIISVSGPIAEWDSWVDYRRCGFNQVIEKALAEDRARDDLHKGLHIRITSEGRRMLCEWRLWRRSQPVETQESATGHVKPPAIRAWQSYRRAMEARSDLADARDCAVYEWLGEQDPDPDYKLPSFETWARHLRSARRYYRAQKNTPRIGRVTGRSVIPASAID